MASIENTEDALIMFVIVIRLKKCLMVREKIMTNPNAMQSKMPFLSNENPENRSVLCAFIFIVFSFKVFKGSVHNEEHHEQTLITRGLRLG